MLRSERVQSDPRRKPRRNQLERLSPRLMIDQSSEKTPRRENISDTLNIPEPRRRRESRRRSRKLLKSKLRARAASDEIESDSILHSKIPNGRT